MDPYSIGYLMGAIGVPTAIGFFVGRALAGPKGASQIDRLKQRAGVLEPDEKVRSRWREVVPYGFALGGALFGLLFGLVSLAGEGRAEADVANAAKLENEFLSNCELSCTSTSKQPQQCESTCACMLRVLKREHPTPEGLHALLRANANKDAASESQVQATYFRCRPEY